MRYYSTNNKNHLFSLRESVLKGIPEDGGLFVPENIPSFDSAEMEQMPGCSLSDIACHSAKKFLKGDLPDDIIESIAREAIDFEAPLLHLEENLHVLELFHGPSLAFKDFGARFLARLMQWLVRGEDRKLTILVATSGDTGGAVASGFHNVEGIEVIILYPSGKVSPLQEKQLTTWGGNIHALKIEGTFDDCQRLAKMAFTDKDLSEKLRLSSANSINIGRLIPQTFYYLYASTRAEMAGAAPVFSVPSGNFGNLCAGLMAQRMGAPVAHFMAATNANDVVPRYLETGCFEPKPSVQTISNAMDVGNPSNFQRIEDLFGHDYARIRKAFSAWSFSDEQTRAAIWELYEHFGYIADPHGAVAYLGWKVFSAQNPGLRGIVLETAHPAKFTEVVEPLIQLPVPQPAALRELREKPGNSETLSTDFQDFKKFFLFNSDIFI